MMDVDAAFDIRIEPVPIEQKPVLRNLLELYIFDFSEFAGWDVSELGLFGYRYLDHYWTEEGRHPFLVRVDSHLAGFALVRHLVEDGVATTHMAEFFVMRKYRRTSVSRAVAHQGFARFPGRWQLTVLPDNTVAIRFWRAAIAAASNGPASETIEPGQGRACFAFTIATPA